MAQQNSPAPIGRRLARLRELQGISAQELADRVKGSGITRAMITNLETGRKRDLTSTEVLQLSTGLEVAVWALLVDTDDPWSQPNLPGLFNVRERETVADLVANRWGDVFGEAPGDIPIQVKELGKYSSEALVALRRYTRRASALYRRETGTDERPESPDDLFVPDGTVADYPFMDSERYEYRRAFEAVVPALTSLSWLLNSPDENLRRVPEHIVDYVLNLREVVIHLARFYGDDRDVDTLEAISEMRLPDELWSMTRASEISNGFGDAPSA